MPSLNNSLFATHHELGMCESFLPRQTRGALCCVWTGVGSLERNGQWLLLTFQVTDDMGEN